jgi:hypothetical protein
LMFAGTTLPTTLKGDDVNASIWNKIWVFVWGILLCLPALLVNLTFLPLVIGVLIGTIVLLSNWKPTARFFPWKLCEFLIGSFVFIPYILQR